MGSVLTNPSPTPNPSPNPNPNLRPNPTVALDQGTRVKAIKPGERFGGWQPAVISKAHSDGSYDVTYEDGSGKGQRLPRGSVRVAGNTVYARWNRGERWRGAEISNTNSDGTFDVIYDGVGFERNVPQEFIRTNDPAWDTLARACREGNEELVQSILRENPDQINYRGMYVVHDQPTQVTLLQLVCVYGSKEIARLLIDNGADFSLRDEWGQEPVDLAQHSGKEEIVSMLMNRGAKCNYEKWSALAQACTTGNKEHFQMLLQEDEFDINCRVPYTKRESSRDGVTLLHVAGAQGQVEIGRLLLERGANTSFLDSWGFTALAWAKYHSCTEMIQLLEEAEQGASTVKSAYGGAKI